MEEAYHAGVNSVDAEGAPCTLDGYLPWLCHPNYREESAASLCQNKVCRYLWGHSTTASTGGQT